MRDDVSALLKEYKINTLGGKNLLEYAERQIRPDERLLFIRPVYIDTTVQGQFETGLAGFFISDLRICIAPVTIDGKEEPVVSILLSAVTSVGSKAAGIRRYHLYFTTAEGTYSFVVGGKKEKVEQVENLLKSAIAQAPPLSYDFNSPKKSSYANPAVLPKAAEATVSVGVSQVKDCAGCGASNVTYTGRISYCEYCGKPMQ